MKFSSAIAASALFVSPALAGLVVKHSVDGLKVTSEVTNDGTEAVTVADHPQSVVGSQFGTDVFKFESADGKSPEFIGITLKWNPEAAKGIVIGAGETKTFTQDVSELYDFSKSGESTYTVSGGDKVYVISPEGKVVPESAKVISTTAKVSGSQASRKRNYTPVYGSLGKRSTYPGCSSAQISQVSQAAIAAQKYVEDTLAYTGTVNSPTPRYKEWFGDFDAGRRAQVMDHFSRMMNDPVSTDLAYDCSTCPGSSLASAFAYVYANQPTTIYLCNAFWNARLTGTDSQAGTIVHELSHFTDNGGTKDLAYGQTNARALASSNPADAVMNADSHEYYAENTPALA